MTWTPRNSYDEDDEDMDDDDDDITSLDDPTATPSRQTTSAKMPGQLDRESSVKHGEVLRVCITEDDEGYNDDLFTPKG